jgi:hypothetical protein
MNAFVIAALIATVTAEAGYECDGGTGWADDVPAGTDTTVKDAEDNDECYDACETLAKAGTGADYCCTAKTTAEDGDTKAKFDCELLKLNTSVDKEIREVKERGEDPEVLYQAWMWVAGKEEDDLGEGSATMISSAIATIAAVAMIAY